MKDNIAKTILCLIVFIVILLMLPLREQGFTDDFAHAQSVRHLLETGEIKVSEWSAPTMIFPILWGSIFSKILGFSFASLHISVITFLPVIAIAMYSILREFKLDPQRSLIFSLFFISIPWIFQFTFTFMTDILFLGLTLLSFFFYLKGLSSNQLRNLIIGSIFASFAFLTRQIGIALPLACLFTAILKKREQSNPIKIALASVSIPILVFITYFIWYSYGDNKSITQYKYEEQLISLAKNFIPYTGYSFVQRLQSFNLLIHRSLDYISQLSGLFFPMIIIVSILNAKKLIKTIANNKLFIVGSFVAIMFVYTYDINNYKETYTLGFPLMLFEYEKLFPIPWAHIWKYIVLLGIPLLVVIISKGIKNVKNINCLQLFTLLTALSFFLISIISYFSWEEYVIPILPFVIIFLSQITKDLNLNKILMLIFIAFLLLDSIQMAKVRYNEEGYIWSKATQIMKQKNISYNEVDPNRNLAWNPWFSYEDDAKDAIKKVNGDKKLANVSSFIPRPKFFIATDRQLKYLQDLKPFITDKDIVQSLFVKSEVKVFFNPQGFNLYNN